MTSQALQTIQMDAGQALNVINTVLPLLEEAVPAVAAAGGPIGLGVAAAAALLPLLEKIPIGTVVTADQQLALFNRVRAIVTSGFAAPQWQPRPPVATTP